MLREINGADAAPAQLAQDIAAAAGALATMIGLGAALSTTLGGQLIQHFGFSASFLGLAAVALLALVLLWIAVPETLPAKGARSKRDTQPK